MSYSNEEVNCTEPSLQLVFPGHGDLSYLHGEHLKIDWPLLNNVIMKDKACLIIFLFCR